MKILFIILHGIVLTIFLVGCGPSTIVQVQTPTNTRITFSSAKDGIPIKSVKQVLDGTMKKICQDEHGRISYGKWGDTCELFRRCKIIGVLESTYKSRGKSYEKTKVGSIYYKYENTVAIKSWNPFNDKNCSTRLTKIDKEIYQLQKETIKEINLRIDKEKKARAEQQKKEREIQALKRKKEQEKQKKLAIERKIKQEKEAKLALKRKKEHDTLCNKILLEIDKSSGLKQIDLYKKFDKLNCK